MEVTARGITLRKNAIGKNHFIGSLSGSQPMIEELMKLILGRSIIMLTTGISAIIKTFIVPSDRRVLHFIYDIGQKLSRSEV